MRVIYRKISHARYLYIKRNVEKVWGARYTLGARYLSKNTVILTAFPQQWLRERASKLCLYVHCLSCYFARTNKCAHFAVFRALGHIIITHNSSF